MSTTHLRSDETGWTNKLDDATTLAMLVTEIRAQQGKRGANGHSGLSGQVNRARYQRQVLGAFGTLRIADDIPDAARVGPFANGPFAYRIACRISSGQPRPQSDTTSGARGIAIKIFTDDGAETDLLMTSESGCTHARNAVQFMAVSEIIGALLAEGPVSGIAQSLRDMMMARLGPVEGARILSVLFSETKAPPADSVTTECYRGPVVRSGGTALRYSLHPHASTPSGSKAGSRSEHTLRDDVLKRLRQGAVKWRLGVQCYVDEETTPLNDASAAWKSDVVTIGELELDAPPSSEDEACIGQLAFDPANGIAQARKDVHAASAAHRQARSLPSNDEARVL